jgi:PD-(D/E)XK nuclease superfamily
MNQLQRHRDTENSLRQPVTARIIGAAIEVHRALGPGRPESLYETALCIELEERAIPYQRQVHEAQLLTYLRLLDKRLGLLINFNSRLVKDGIRRFVL